MDLNDFKELNSEELQITGSGFLGAAFGALVGWTVGVPVALVYSVATGKSSYENTMNICNTAATVGAYIGACSPTL